MPQVNHQILGLGGGGDTPEQTRALLAHAVSLTGTERPRVLHVPTAMGDADTAVVAFYERFAGLGELSHMKFHPWPPAGLRELALGQDAIFVGGGSTANMLAVWRVHGFDRILREAWDAGVLLFGWSAGIDLVDSGFPEGMAADDGVGLHYVGTQLREVVTCRPGAAAYRVTRDGEERLQARLIS
jgi:dipeptidase E